ncbi:Uncharacterised protein [uncultured archaeon]|nr:Uncharacterised protein [uncultured archaeon]
MTDNTPTVKAEVGQVWINTTIGGKFKIVKIVDESTLEYVNLNRRKSKDKRPLLISRNQLENSEFFKLVEIQEPGNLKNRIEELEDCLRGAILYLEHGPPIPPMSDHHCGPDSNCDTDCVNWAYCKWLNDAKGLLK